MNFAIHPPEACTQPRQHCAWHNIDEPGGWRNCGECGHAYPTAGALRRTYRRMVWQVFAGEPLWRIWRCLTVRASRIDYCPLCAHDL